MGVLWRLLGDDGRRLGIGKSVHLFRPPVHHFSALSKGVGRSEAPSLLTLGQSVHVVQLCPYLLLYIYY